MTRKHSIIQIFISHKPNPQTCVFSYTVTCALSCGQRISITLYYHAYLVAIFSCKCTRRHFTAQKGEEKKNAAEDLTQGRHFICLTPNLNSNAKLPAMHEDQKFGPENGAWLVQASGAPEFQVLFLPTHSGYELLQLLAWLSGLEVPELHHDVSGK